MCCHLQVAACYLFVHCDLCSSLRVDMGLTLHANLTFAVAA